jgi:hypothetical protein
MHAQAIRQRRVDTVTLIRGLDRNADSGDGLEHHVVPLLFGAALLVAALRGGSYDAVSRTEAFTLIWWILPLATALGLFPRYRPPPAIALAIVGLLLLAGWTALSALWTDSLEGTFAETARVLGFVGLLLLAAGAIGSRDAIEASAALTVSAVVVCAMALVTRMAPDVLPSTLAASGYERRRLAYPFDYWNALGCWAAMTVALCIAWSAHARRWWVRAAALAGVPLAMSVAYLTYSRASAASMACGALVVVALSRHRWTAAVNALVAAGCAAVVVAIMRGQAQIADGTGTVGARDVVVALGAVGLGCVAVSYALSRTAIDQARVPARVTRAALAVGLALAMVTALVQGPALANNAWQSFRSSGTFRGSDPAARLTNLGGPRYEIWRVAIDSFAAHPLRGSGAGTFEYVWTRKRPEPLFVRDAHSLYLESLAELGAVGALLVVLVFAVLLTAAVRAGLTAPDPSAVAVAGGGAAAFVVYCLSAGVDWMWESTAITAAGLVAAVLAVGTVARPARPARASVRTATTVLALGALMVQLPLLIASSRVRDSQSAFARHDFRSALEEATTASEAEPWAAAPLLQRALILEGAGRLAAARADAVAATHRETTNWRTWIVLARIETERGRVRAALHAVKRARELNPRSPLFSARRRGG